MIEKDNPTAQELIRKWVYLKETHKDATGRRDELEKLCKQLWGQMQLVENSLGELIPNERSEAAARTDDGRLLLITRLNSGPTILVREIEVLPTGPSQ